MAEWEKRIEIFRTFGDWLKARTTCIGGSDAACVVGLNPWKTNVDLWEEKTGRKTAPDIGDNPAVKYGQNAESALRELFALDYPEYNVGYIKNNMWTNPEYPFAHASLDGWLTDAEGRLGILEIKTTKVSSLAQMDKWDNKIPDNYYCQILHYFAVTGAEFAILKAQIKKATNPHFIQTRHYMINREDCLDDIIALMIAEKQFADCIKNDTCPALILPEI